MEPMNGTEIAHESPPVQLPVRAGDVMRFTPPAAEDLEPKPVYHLRVPSLSARAAFQRDMVTRCGQFPSNDTLRWALKRALKDIEDAAADPDALFEALAGEDKDAAREAALALSELENLVSRADPRYAALVAARGYYQAMMPLVTLQHLLVGWDNVEGEFRRLRGLTAEDTIARLPRVQFLQVSTQAMLLLSATEQLAKNSAPPS